MSAYDFDYYSKVPDYLSQQYGQDLKEMREEETQKTKTLSSGIGIGTNLFKMWKDNQNLEFEQLLANKVDYIDSAGIKHTVNAFKLNPNYQKYSTVEKMLTPAKERVILNTKGLAKASVKGDILKAGADMDKVIDAGLPDVATDKVLDSIADYEDFATDIAGKTRIARVMEKLGPTLNVVSSLSSLGKIASKDATGGEKALAGTNLFLKAAPKILAKVAPKAAAKIAGVAAGPLGWIITVLDLFASQSKEYKVKRRNTDIRNFSVTPSQSYKGKFY